MLEKDLTFYEEHSVTIRKGRYHPQPHQPCPFSTRQLPKSFKSVRKGSRHPPEEAGKHPVDVALIICNHHKLKELEKSREMYEEAFKDS
jgi:hypothetical protein